MLTRKIWAKVNSIFVVFDVYKSRIWSGLQYFVTPIVPRANYKHLLNSFLSSDATRRTLSHILQQSGASEHYYLAVRQFLNEKILHSWIGKVFSISWPPRSQILVFKVFPLWFLKDTAYQTVNISLTQLKKIICLMKSVNADLFQNVWKSSGTQTQPAIR